MLIEGIRGDSYTGDIGIDDVSFTTGCKQFSGNLPVAPPISPTSNPATVTTKPHQCTTAEFNCVNQGSGACIPSTQVILEIDTSLLWTSDSDRNCLFFFVFFFYFKLNAPDSTQFT